MFVIHFSSVGSSLKMSEFDTLAAYFLNNTLLPLIVLFIIAAFLLTRLNSVRQRFFAWLYMQFQISYSIGLAQCKEDLFAPLQNFRSLNWNLRNQGLIRILEIGVGPGTNFGYYPKNARVILVDPNPHFKRYLEANKAKFPQVKIEKVLLGEGEDLRDIEDGSVDVVVTTIVLCSVCNLQQVLSEIQRVLAMGGQFFFIEHIAADEGSWQRFVQKSVNYVWKQIFDGCEITRDIEKAIERAGFVDTEFKHCVVHLPSYVKIFLNPHVYGTAKKKKTLN